MLPICSRSCGLSWWPCTATACCTAASSSSFFVSAEIATVQLLSLGYSRQSIDILPMIVSLAKREWRDVAPLRRVTQDGGAVVEAAVLPPFLLPSPAHAGAAQGRARAATATGHRLHAGSHFIETRLARAFIAARGLYLMPERNA